MDKIDKLVEETRLEDLTENYKAACKRPKGRRA